MEGTKAMSDTPETDAAVEASGGDWSPVLRAVAQRLERERDAALMDRANGDIATMTINHYERILRERNAALELAEAFHRDQVTLLLERDRLDNALMKIEDLFVDGTDIYADRENMGLIARAALAQHK
jgi:hypothetical protein